jgi:hypothetical protein
MNTNNLSVHVPDDDIYYRNKKKKETYKKTIKRNDFGPYELFDFYCFQLEQLVDLDIYSLKIKKNFSKSV